MKKLTKLTLLFTLLLTSCFALASCGGSGDSTAPDVDDSGNVIVSILFHVDAKSSEGIAYKKRVDEFNKAHASEKIKANPQFKARTNGAADYDTELSNKMTEGTLPDIFTYDSPNCAKYANDGLLLDLSKIIDADYQANFYEASLDKFHGRLYGLPIQESSAGFFYNKAIFEQAGVDVSNYSVTNPWTFSEFEEACQKINAIGKTAVDMRLDATKDETATYLLYPFIYAAGGSFTSNDGRKADGYYNSAASKNGFSFLKRLVDNGYTSYSIGATDFVTGKVGMYLSSGWTIPEIENNYQGPGKTFVDDNSWGILPYPKEVNAASATGSWSFGAGNNGKKNKDAVAKLLMWMTSEESSKVITDATGMIPAVKSLASSVTNPKKQVLLNQLAETGVRRPATVCYPEFSTGFRGIINGLRNGNVDSLVESATTELDSRLSSK